jgi:hypothetical protein
MSDESQPSATALYPTDVGKAMQLLAQRKIVDADAVVEAFLDVRRDACDAEVARVVAWLKRRACPTPASWAALLQSLEDGEHRHT